VTWQKAEHQVEDGAGEHHCGAEEPGDLNESVVAFSYGQFFSSNISLKLLFQCPLMSSQ
jgi:hypothetical protein